MIIRYYNIEYLIFSEIDLERIFTIFINTSLICIILVNNDYPIILRYLNLDINFLPC